MYTQTQKQLIEIASDLMGKYSLRTGLAKDYGSPASRYLWTDAYAALNFLALGKESDQEMYDQQARQLIQDVHHQLGKYVLEDKRKGWISGLSEQEAEAHPTFAGLRIGKKLAEREIDNYDQRLEWERDGQYYHYHTRWIVALLKSGSHFNQKELYQWAAELSLAGAKFISVDGNKLKMFWKMSVDLSRPLIPLMGAHDPLEGLLCALKARELSGIQSEAFDDYIDKLEKLCATTDWYSNDTLGIGGLLLNVVRAAELHEEMQLPAVVQPQRILTAALEGLCYFISVFHPDESAENRLPFRECGLSLGLRAIQGNTELLHKQGLSLNFGDAIWKLAEQIDSFWMKEENQKFPSFQEHLDINEVSLAASILASAQPEIYSRLSSM